MAGPEKSFLHESLMEQAGFEKREIEQYGGGLERNAHLYYTIFRVMSEKNLGKDFWHRFQIFAGTMMTWANHFAEDKLLADHARFFTSLNIGTIRGFEDLDTQLGRVRTEDTGHTESLLTSWSYFAATMSHAKLGDKYVNFLDKCAEQAVGYPTYRWNYPFGQVPRQPIQTADLPPFKIAIP